MEAVYLVFSIASSALTSALFSLRLALRCLMPSSLGRSTPSADEDGAPPPLWLYEGHVRHVRQCPRRHAFEYPVRYALVDLDRASSSSILPSSFAGHLSPDTARAAAGTNGPVQLLTIPASVGYELNPISVYYCYDVVPATTQQQTDRSNNEQGATTQQQTARSNNEQGATTQQQTDRSNNEQGATALRLKKCIAEVTNTPWGERVSFVFDPRSDLVAKTLHVSPFMDMLGNWNFRAGEPGENLFIGISVQHPTLGNYFTVDLIARRVSMSSFSTSELGLALFFWLMPQKVALWIYWQAFKLWWKNVSFIQHPRYSNPMYREDALLRDQELCCPLVKERNRNGDPHLDDYSLVGAVDGKSENRWCVWRNAAWPWS